MTQIYVKPAKDRATPDPDNGGDLLPEAGSWVTNSAYWQRRLADSDVVESEPPAESAPSEMIAIESPAEPGALAVVETKPLKGSKGA